MMFNIPKQEYTPEFKELAGFFAKSLKTIRNLNKRMPGDEQTVSR